MVTNANFPTDNELEIPVLPLAAQAQYIDQPVGPWAGHSDARHWRPSRGPKGVLCFYTQDAAFTHLLIKPTGAYSCPAPVFAELNLSLDESTPVWRAIELTAKKRLFSSLVWADAGKEILVDLYVPSQWFSLNLMGVPPGWRSYATRAADTRLADLRQRHQLAIEHFEAGSDKPYEPGDLVFLVYGGGPKVREYCQRHHLEYAQLDVERYHRHRQKRYKDGE